LKKILVLQWYESAESERNAEIEKAFNHNLSLNFDEFIIFNENNKINYSSGNIKNLNQKGRYTFRDYLNVASITRADDTMVVTCNSDIALDPFIASADFGIDKKTLYCISRYEEDGSISEHPWATQDVWIIQSQKIHNSALNNSDIPLGTPGCELRFAELMYNIGYKVYNPCLSLKNFHIHRTQLPHNDEIRNYGAYLFTHACTLEDARNKANIEPVPVYLAMESSLKRIL